jgi:hypothetical protein
VGDMCTIIFLLAASAFNEILPIIIIRSLGNTIQQSNYTVLYVIKGIPSSFLRHTTIKLFKGSDYTCNQYDGYTQAEGDTTQQSNI